MRNLLAHLILSLWPLHFGLDRLMELLRPTCPPEALVERKLRGFPLRMTFSPHTYMGMFLYYRGLYEEAIVVKLRQLLKPGMIFIDVGANAGMYTLIASHLVGPQGQVVAFEPQSRLRDILHRNLELNSITNVDVRAEALGRVPGAGQIFQVNPTNDGQATIRVRQNEKTFSQPENISVAALDELILDLHVPRIDGMKIDVEGAEHDALLGLDSILEHAPPLFIFFECIEAHLRRFDADTAMLFANLTSHGYHLYCLYRGKWRQVRSPEDHKRYHLSTDFLAIRSGDGDTP